MPNSLRVIDKTTRQLSPTGYASIVDQLILNQDNLEDFDGEKDNRYTKARTRKLVKYAGFLANGTSTNATITQLGADGTTETVTPDTTVIRANEDERHTATGAAKVGLALPEQALLANELDYIEDYIRTFLKVWTGDNGADLPVVGPHGDPLKAKKFAFGAMLLTRCR